MMFRLISKILYCARSAITASPCKTKAQNLFYFLHIRPFSSCLKSIETSPEQNSFTVTYLVNSCAFPLEKALSASKYLNLKSRDKPDSVLAFLENQGFTKTQISTLIRKNPLVLRADPQKTLLPKLEFFKSRGVSSTEVAEIVSNAPTILGRSLENQIIPSFNFVKEITQSEVKAITVIKRYGDLFKYDLHANFASNVKVLQEAGVPNANIVSLLTKQPRTFLTTPQNFKQAVENVRAMGFDPSKYYFAAAVGVLRGMSRSIWEKKVEVYKKWGWSEDDILLAFGKNTSCMTASEGKIMAVMDFAVNKMGLQSSSLVKRPKLVSLSLEKRMVPRFAVYQALLSKNVIKKSSTSG